ncbi:hypothetical protein D623_10014869 [Myotis brandtii]|uniref:Uncharacterized protein n=1 Tax=Myotis brandtii TaxID=109478 RepID=S7Q405_MYOBR|nr:hypothetical protein D623_10014869 [Myotis brandtii]
MREILAAPPGAADVDEGRDGSFQSSARPPSRTSRPRKDDTCPGAPGTAGTAGTAGTHPQQATRKRHFTSVSASCSFRPDVTRRVGLWATEVPLSSEPTTHRALGSPRAHLHDLVTGVYLLRQRPRASGAQEPSATLGDTLATPQATAERAGGPSHRPCTSRVRSWVVPWCPILPRRPGCGRVDMSVSGRGWDRAGSREAGGARCRGHSRGTAGAQPVARP